jgi:heme-degrading monooxygenase HmoA
MYAVIFKATLNCVDNHYETTATRLRELAKQQYNCIDFFAVSDSKRELAISYWSSLDDINKWKNNPEHRAAQALGKEKWYQHYQVEIVKIEKSYTS